ncbi:SH3 domain-containing protein 21 isoform X2 [Thalassophryne amazonica]|uniref:SH3 domain-containing protein 21 isoform X2 n=1 Tax=Thalassophryne amazonica TaxID=390379 RepID=UPI001470AB62|nr:SH3 domain-containing protein 21 isoform X2 [Thalassophryne amazonica]
MEVLVLHDFEGTMGDELTVKMGDVVQNVTKSSEEGWLIGDLKGKRGMIPASFCKEVPVCLMGGSNREPRSIRKVKKKQVRQCEVAFAYSPINEDELELIVGETIELIKEIEDGWWMGLKNGKIGAFPSNFVKEIFVCPKDVKHHEGKLRPKITDATFSKAITQRASVRNKAKNEMEYCQVMFDYKAQAEDELDLKKGDIIKLVRKETEDEGWWEGELNGRCGCFPDNFVMVIPQMDSLKSGNASKPPARTIADKPPVKTEVPVMEKGGTKTTKVKTEVPAMDKGGTTTAKDDKTPPKDLRSNPPTKVKLPPIQKPSPPPIKDKPIKFLPITNGDLLPVSSKQQEEKGSDQFDGVQVQTDKLSHPTANRAKPPHRRPPSGLATGGQDQTGAELTEPESPPKKSQTEKVPALQMITENPTPSPEKHEHTPKTPPPVQPAPLKTVVGGKPVVHKEEPSLESLQAEIKELRMALELLQTRHERDMQEMKEELTEEKSKRLALQEEVRGLRMKH